MSHAVHASLVALGLYVIGAVSGWRAIRKTRASLARKLVFSLGWPVTVPLTWCGEIFRWAQR